MVPLLFISTMLTPGAQAQDLLDPGVRVERALSAQVTETGLNQIEVVVAELVPDLLPTDLLDIGDLDFGIGSLSNVQPAFAVDSVDLRPTNGRLFIDVGASVSLNSAAEPFELDFFLCNSDGYIREFPIDLAIAVRIQVVTPAMGSRRYDVTVDLQTITSDLQGSDLVFIDGGFGCSITGGLIGALDAAVISALQPTLQTAITDLEPTIEDALNQAVFQDSLELLDAELAIDIEPKQVRITPDGLELQYSSTAEAVTVANCINEVDPGGSLLTDTPVPDIIDLPLTTQVGAHVSDDMVNQIVYAAYRGGLLCFTVDENAGIDLPIALDSSLLELLGGEGFKEIIGEEPKPLVIQTFPNKVPRAYYDGANHVDIEVRQLGLGFYTEVDGRIARAIAMEIDADAGVNVDFDGNTGEVFLDLALGGDDIDIRVVPDSLVKGTEQAIEDGVSGLVDTLLGALLGDLLSGPLIALPTFSGLGLQSLDFFASGDDGDWLTAEAAVSGNLPYGDAAGGCDEGADGGDGGCDAGCADTGCASSGGVGGAVFFLLPIWMLRRRP